MYQSKRKKNEIIALEQVFKSTYDLHRLEMIFDPDLLSILFNLKQSQISSFDIRRLQVKSIDLFFDEQSHLQTVVGK